MLPLLALQFVYRQCLAAQSGLYCLASGGEGEVSQSLAPCCRTEIVNVIIPEKPNNRKTLQQTKDSLIPTEHLGSF